MRCCRCGRGITYRRIDRDAAFIVGDAEYCGPCFDEIDPGEETVVIVLGDSPATLRAKVVVPDA